MGTFYANHYGKCYTKKECNKTMRTKKLLLARTEALRAMRKAAKEEEESDEEEESEEKSDNKEESSSSEDDDNSEAIALSSWLQRGLPVCCMVRDLHFAKWINGDGAKYKNIRQSK